MSVDLDSPKLESLSATKGIIFPTVPGGRGGFLSDVIVELGFCSREDVDRAVGFARENGRQVTSVLLQSGELTSYELARAIAERNGLPYADLDEVEIDPTAQLLIDRFAATRYHAMPIAFSPDGALVVALADPLDVLAVSDIAVMTKSELLPVVADAEALSERIERMPKATPRALPVLEEPERPPDPVAATAPAPAPAPAPQAPEAAPDAGDAEPNGGDPRLAIVPEPAGDPDLSHGLRDRIVAAVETAVEGIAEGEVARLESELESERTARGELEKLRADDQAARRELSETVAEAIAKRDELAAHLAELEQRTAGAGHESEELRTRLGELQAEAETRARELEQSDTRAAQAEQRAAAAEQAAAQAEQRAAAAEQAVAETERRAAEAQRTLGDAEGRIAEAERRADEAVRKVSDLEQQATAAAAQRDRLRNALSSVTEALDTTAEEPPAR